MKTPPAWPIVPSDRDRLLTLDQVAKWCGSKHRSNLRNWLIREGFHFVLARLGVNNQLLLRVRKEEWPGIAERWVARGFALAAEAGAGVPVPPADWTKSRTLEICTPSRNLQAG
jgi:hypothetical protein